MKIEKFANEIVMWIDKNYDQKTNGEVWDNIGNTIESACREL